MHGSKTVLFFRVFTRGISLTYHLIEPVKKEKGWQSSLLRPLLPASTTTRCRPMAFTAYARIGGRGKSELRAVNVLISLCPGSSLISIPNSKIQTRRVLALQKERIDFPSLPASFAKRNTAKQYGESENRFGFSPETILARTHRPRRPTPRSELRGPFFETVMSTHHSRTQGADGGSHETCGVLEMWVLRYSSF